MIGLIVDSDHTPREVYNISAERNALVRRPIAISATNLVLEGNSRIPELLGRNSEESLSTLRSVEKSLPASARGAASSMASSAPQPIKGFTRVMALGVTISRVIQEFIAQKPMMKLKKIDSGKKHGKK